MLSSLIPLRADIDPDTAQHVSERLFEITGPLFARAWPGLEEWLDDLAPEFAIPRADHPVERFQLDDRELRQLLSPEFSTIYHVRDASLLAQLVLAVDRHSELSLVCLPPSVSRGKLIHLLMMADHLNFEGPVLQTPLRANWLLNLGVYNVDEPSMQLLTDKDDLHFRLYNVLQLLGIEAQGDVEGTSS